MKTIALSLALFVACSQKQTGPNLVVEALKDLPDKPACDAYFTDLGDRHVHTAKCTLSDKSEVYCILNADMIGVACGPLVQQPLKAPEKK